MDYPSISVLLLTFFLDVDDNQIVTTLASNVPNGILKGYVFTNTNGEGFGCFNDNSLHYLKWG